METFEEAEYDDADNYAMNFTPNSERAPPPPPNIPGGGGGKGMVIATTP